MKNVAGTRSLFFFFLLAYAFIFAADGPCYTLPEGFVYVEDVIPNVKVELKYYSSHNFIGRPIKGYLKPRCILTGKAAEALKEVEQDLNAFGLGLKIFDGYRPQRAVDHFVEWAKALDDTKMKEEFYPNVKKGNLFKEDYIAARSSHSRGSTVDLTIVSINGASRGVELDMGSAFDFFGPESWPNSLRVSPNARAHRMLLQLLMKKRGFKPYSKEWWHFTLKDEPFPNTYFNFPVQ